MIEIYESWDSIIHRIDGKPLRRGRGRCPLCESNTGFSVHEDRGFHCFACGAHGDKISFVQQLHNFNFKNGLRFFGLEAGRPPAPDPVVIRRQKIREGLRRWARTVGRELRFEHHVRERVIVRAQDRLSRDPEDSWAWNWLAWALPGQEAISNRLDMIEGTDEKQLEAYRQVRAT